MTERDAPWRATVFTIFPEMFPGPLGHSLAGRAREAGIWSLETVDIRRYASDKHASVDGPAFGDGGGMVMRPDVLAAALDAHVAAPGPALALSARGQPLTQARIRALVSGPGVRLVCGRYEGIDERFLEARDVEEISVGDYVLSGGEPAALVVIDAVLRLLPGVTGMVERLANESFEDGLLEHPQYTRPRVFEGRTPPAVLVSGDHAEIARWRRAAAEESTRARRPDLWREYLRTRRPIGHRGGQENER
jgi:tRNA (guanine37-N1)-methyltransferase